MNHSLPVAVVYLVYILVVQGICTCRWCRSTAQPLSRFILTQLLLHLRLVLLKRAYLCLLLIDSRNKVVDALFQRLHCLLTVTHLLQMNSAKLVLFFLQSLLQLDRKLPLELLPLRRCTLLELVLQILYQDMSPRLQYCLFEHNRIYTISSNSRAKQS